MSTVALAGPGFLRSHRCVILYHPRLYFGPWTSSTTPSGGVCGDEARRRSRWS